MAPSSGLPGGMPGISGATGYYYSSQYLLLASYFDLVSQSRIPAALCALHNFMQVMDKEEDLPEHIAANNGENPIIVEENHPEVNIFFEPQEEQEMRSLRDHIATRMWEDYHVILTQRLWNSQGEDMMEILSSVEEEELLEFEED